MILDVVVTAEPRATRGKNESKRARRAGKVPAVVYGAFKDPQAISVNPKDILKIVRSKTGHNSIFNLDIPGVEHTPVIVADEQYDPIKGALMHVDLKRIDMARPIKVSVPVMMTGDAKMVKQVGGTLDFITRRVEIECLPADIPDHYIVDITSFGKGSAMRVKDLVVKEGTRVLTPGASILAHVVGGKEEVAVAVVEEAPKKGKKK